MGEEIRYYVTLPFQDKEFPAPTYERADAQGTAIRIELHGWREENEFVPVNAE